ncbi:ligninase lg6 precursor [Colletotrichum karsti]|uniref:Peroxidase n=1 Tax=Colletotrichum karsti TaxID=1095194 RepID=A0A9P6HUR1_9PEZI|nr:ligninase lg6 precursor [Colletotrichum karsti]KAF9870202.1 ligninase lg6 precursor [Colletotrichum karsti]
MRTSSLLVAGLLALSHAATLPSPNSPVNDLVARKGGSDDGGSSGKGKGSGDSSGSGSSTNQCTVWQQVNKDLNTRFMAGDQCNDLARAAIRAIFHDCGSWDNSQGFSGGCDGSLVLGKSSTAGDPDELFRPENRGLQTIAKVLQDMAGTYGTSVADMIVFAGNAAIFLCPGGPKVKTFVGRKDSTANAKPGGLPDVFGSAQSLFALFAAKGFSAEDLAALLGAHSTSTQNFVDPKQANASQDSTPGKWDVNYYSETYNYAVQKAPKQAPPGVFVFPSDEKLATDTDTGVGKKFQGFIGNQNKWASSFSNAMEKMALFGNNKGTMTDCTDAIARV